MEREYTVVYTAIEDGWIMATVPELPGAMTQGRDLAEAREMIRDAIREVLASYRELAQERAPAEAIWETVAVELPAPTLIG